MKNTEAIQLVKNQIALEGDEEFTAEKVKDFDNYWYVSCAKAATGKNTGGYAYVVNVETGVTYAVPNSMPAHFNLRSVVSGDAVEVSTLPKHHKNDNTATV